jgi:hypothetical protein
MINNKEIRVSRLYIAAFICIGTLTYFASEYAGEKAAAQAVRMIGRKDESNATE